MYRAKRVLRMTARQLEIMRVLASKKQWTIGEIAVVLGVSSAAATKNIDRLQLRGMVVRMQDLMDRRVINVHLTTAGTEALRKESTLERKLEFKDGLR